MQEKLPTDQNSEQGLEEIFSNILSRIKNSIGLIPNPTLEVPFVELFKNAGDKGIEMSELVLLFGENNSKNRKRAATYVDQFNKRHKKGDRVKIEGTLVYRPRIIDSEQDHS